MYRMLGKCEKHDITHWCIDDVPVGMCPKCGEETGENIPMEILESEYLDNGEL